MLGYGVLTLSYWYGLGWDGKKRPLAWLFAVLFALTDEFHQSFTAGRHPSIWDVVIFDNLGAVISLWLAGMFIKKRSGENA